MSVLSPALPIAQPNIPENSASPVILIYNPTSGPTAFGAGMGLAPLLPSATDYKAHPPAWLEEARAFIKAETGVEPLIAATETQEEAEQIARDAANRSVPLVIAAGGDGT